MERETSPIGDDQSSIYMEDGSFWERTHKPRLIILIRHGESESNKDKKINENVPN